jgi:hypothetical protein
MEPSSDIHPHSALFLSSLFILIFLLSVGNQINHTPPGTRDKSNQSHALSAIDQVKRNLAETQAQKPSTATERSFNLFTIPLLNELRINAKSIKPISLTPTLTPVKTIFPISPIIPTNINHVSLLSPIEVSGQPKQIETIVSLIPTKKVVATNPEKAVIQILCKLPSDKGVKYISSTGFLISETGLILTNAHVGIHPFLDTYTEKNITCTGRHGSPALSPFSLELVYISPQWTSKHQGETSGTFNPDTGEFDIALLRTHENLVEAGLSIVNLQKNQLLNRSGLLNRGSSMEFIAYPISNTPTSLIQRKESLLIDDLYTITKGNLIKSSNSTVGKAGASGGPLINTDQDVIGMASNIVSSSLGGVNSSKINAIDITHINNTLISDTGISLDTLINSNGDALKRIFENRLKNEVLQHLN